MKDITAIIVTFLRDKCLFRCISSLRRTYPQIKILVGDNGHLSLKKLNFVRRYKGEYYRLPFACGISYGRNFLLKKVKTLYFLVGDDDFYYTKSAGIEKMKKLLDIADIVGGRLKEGNEIRKYEIKWREEDGGLVYEQVPEKHKYYKGVPYIESDMVFNYFVAPIDLGIEWDKNIKVAFEHSDFFLNCKKKKKKVICSVKSIVHHKKETFPEYEKYRYSFEDKEYFFKKWKYKFLKDVRGQIIQ